MLLVNNSTNINMASLDLSARKLVMLRITIVKYFYLFLDKKLFENVQLSQGMLRNENSINIINLIIQ